jgi:hypothetical protein
LRARSASFDAWLLGPWLGSDPAVAERIREHVGLPLGEVSSGPGGAAGARFDAARDRLLAEMKVKQLSTRIDRVSARGAELVLEGEDEELVTDAVVLALGGVAAGGIVLVHAPEQGRRGFRLGLEAPCRLRQDDEVASEASSLYGPSLESSGFGPLERVGIDVTGAGLVRSDDGRLRGLAAAGDCVAGRPRSLLEAVRSGCVAARTLLASN